MISTTEHTPIPSDKITELQQLLQFHKFDFLPNIPGMASETYAQELAKFLNDSSLADHSLHQILGQQLIHFRQRTANPSAFFGELHRAEASVRRVTPWIQDRILHIQEDLYKHGYFDTHDFIHQRSFLYSYLSTPENPQTASPEETGREVSALELCAPDFYALEQLDPLQAADFLKDVQRHFGLEAYTLTLLWQNSAEEGAAATPQQLRTYQERMLDGYEKFRKTYLSLLPEEIQDQLFQVQRDADERASTRIIPVHPGFLRKLRSLFS